ncbi:MAG: GyrI-like domain-containing protein [Anaerolineae bacterium]|nr:GyrI-like domain-containing protein [Anaerolineae bacterium]
MTFPCEIQELGTRPTLSIRFRAPVGELPQHFGRIYGAIMQYLGELGAAPAGPPFAAYYNMDMEDMDVEAGFPVASSQPAKGDILAGKILRGAFAVCHYTGPYDAMGPAYDMLTSYAMKHGYAPTGAVYEWYLTGPEVPPQETKTDIAFPVRPVKEPHAV